MGPFTSAYMKVFGREAGRRFVSTWLESFEEHLHEACLGQVSEIFDGDAPHASRGCVAQAWSVAELLRVVSDLETTDQTDINDVIDEQVFSSRPSCRPAQMLRARVG